MAAAAAHDSAATAAVVTAAAHNSAAAAAAAVATAAAAAAAAAATTNTTETSFAAAKHATKPSHSEGNETSALNKKRTGKQTLQPVERAIQQHDCTEVCGRRCGANEKSAHGFIATGCARTRRCDEGIQCINGNSNAKAG